MVDYFQSGTTAPEAGGNAQPAANGDANMDDEILVRRNLLAFNTIFLIENSKHKRKPSLIHVIEGDVLHTTPHLRPFIADH